MLLVGCVPLWVNTYYSPNAEGGTVKKSQCNESAGPPDMIQFVRNDVTIGVKATDMGDHLSVFVQIQIPKDREARLLSAIIHVSIPSNPTPFEGLLNPIIYHDQSAWNIGDAMSGETREFKGIFRSLFLGKFYGMEAKIKVPKSDTLKVILPELEINGQKMQIPEISFTKDKSLEVFGPVNC
jgi:hypothetical protein